MPEEKTIRQLDAHALAIMDEYHAVYHDLKGLEDTLYRRLSGYFEDMGLIVASVEGRVKSEDSLAGKLELKGQKYNSLFDITDIIGLRVITFYIDDVEKVATVLERNFEIDWENSVDKRKAHETDSFGYLSLHYVCRIPEGDPAVKDCPELQNLHFEVQIRTVLQHAWANMNHDTGYKSGVEVPKAYLRQLSRLAGMLELVDDEFSRIRNELTDYRRQMHALVANGNLADVPLDGETFRSFLELKPFDELNRRIAAVNQAEIMDVSLMNFLPVFKGMTFKTLGDLATLIKEYSDAAFQLSRYQISLSDIDIISSSLGPQNLCIVYALRSGSGKLGVRFILDALNGPSPSNDAIADYLMDAAKDLPFMNK